MSLTPDMMPAWELRDHLTQRENEITALRAENERLRSIITAADRGAPIYKAVERTLDEKSAWIARPNHDVTTAVALTAGIAWSIHYPLHLADENVELQLKVHRAEAENERLRAALKEAYEVYAGSDGFIPETCAEGYQQQIIKQMVDIISEALEVKE